MKIEFSGIECPVDSASFRLQVTPNGIWGTIEIRTKRVSGSCLNYEFENNQIILELVWVSHIRKWQDLDGLKLRCVEPEFVEEEKDVFQGLYYVLDHNWFTSGILRLFAQGKNVFRAELEAISSEGNEVKFSLDLVFEGARVVMFEHQSADFIRSRVSKYIDVDGFDQKEITFQTGETNLYESWFVPVVHD